MISGSRFAELLGILCDLSDTAQGENYEGWVPTTLVAKECMKRSFTAYCNKTTSSASVGLVAKMLSVLAKQGYVERKRLDGKQMFWRPVQLDRKGLMVKKRRCEAIQRNEKQIIAE